MKMNRIADLITIRQYLKKQGLTVWAGVVDSAINDLKKLEEAKKADSVKTNLDDIELIHCPSCNAELNDTELEAGKCSMCGLSLEVAHEKV